MSAVETSHELQVALQAPYLKKTWGERWDTATGLVTSALCELAVASAKCSIVRVAPADALPYIGEERGGIERAPSESVEDYRARLVNAWADWKKADSDPGVVGALGVLGYNVAIKRDRQWVHDASPPGAIWARMWIILVDPLPAWPIVETWADMAAKYPTYADWAAARVGWGLEAPLDEIARITRIALKWTGSHTLVVNIIVIARGRVFGYPDAAMYSDLPAGTYDSYVAYWDGF